MRNPFLSGPLKVPVVNVFSDEHADIPKAAEAGSPSASVVKSSLDHHGNSDDFTPAAQEGVRAIEAATQFWTRKQLMVVYAFMWLLMFVDSLHQGFGSSFKPYITSAFEMHSMTPYIDVMSGLIGGIFKLPLAKMMDVVGRPHGFALSIFLLILGLVMMACCTNVQIYAASQIFYWLGYNSMSYSLSLIVADTTSLQNRGFMFAFINSPAVITIWAAGPVATAFLNGPGWRWAYGIFAIVTIVASMPIFWILILNYMSALKRGIIQPRNNGLIEFDAIGVFLAAGGLVFTLLPFSLWSTFLEQWHSPMIIAFFIIGGLMSIGFVVFEKYFAPVTFIPYKLVRNRTIIGANVLAGVLFISFFTWSGQFFSFLQVVGGLSVTEATYVCSIYTCGSCIFSLIVGVALRKTGRFKWIALYFGVPLTILANGLMIHFRGPDQNIGYIIMCQVFIACAGGACTITEQIAAMSAVDHQFVAIVLAVELMITSVMGGIGSTIAVSIWTSVFPDRLRRYLPQEVMHDFDKIVNSLPQQLSYPKGSPARLAIEKAYGDGQRYLCIASTSVLVLGLFAVIAWRDIRIKDHRQKGTVI
ncbi:MFS general substrate transporter [Byssothecium circinans]|uniref:MFS general substrate transporter n=1 Tax=Byssothecium circinans TaxID=147558 RepID=A0A6A5UC94_9PLEO|nr:MFS general substrate transporter [Byssothecium circinans]